MKEEKTKGKNTAARKTAKRAGVVQFLDKLLAIDRIEDLSRNGLQVEGAATIRRVGLAVDACLASFEAATLNDCEMLIVHHGMIWGSLRSLTGDVYRQVRFLIEASLNLYAVHLPLDLHPELGNNARLAAAIGIKKPFPFGIYNGIPIGFEGTIVRPLRLDTLCRALEKVTGGTTLALPFGKKFNKRIAIVSGGASSIIGEAVAKHVDCFITGEPNHAHYHLAREAGLNVIYGGHYHSETLGVKAVGKALEREFGIESVFLDIPTTV
ncbi:MAG: Nif3-like dinuclear metal center hexameric protein [Chitinispirillaceae bacterium]|jgi:dinuclear metal center YbgI/SA1388 family protein